jgi:hypothetical protein
MRSRPGQEDEQVDPAMRTRGRRKCSSQLTHGHTAFLSALELLVPPQNSIDRDEIQTASVMSANIASAQDHSSRTGQTIPSLPQGHTAFPSASMPLVPPRSNAERVETRSRVRTICEHPRVARAAQHSRVGCASWSTKPACTTVKQR